jgi:hypothetical protein
MTNRRRPKIPYYVVRNGRGYWEPSAALKKLGYSSVACGQDGPEAWRKASEWDVKARADRERSKPPKKPMNNVTDLETYRGHVYFLFSNGSIKIGFTKNITTRLDDLKTGLACGVECFIAVQGTPLLERALHRKFYASRMSGEWFEPTKDLLAFIAKVAAAGTLRVTNFETDQNIGFETKNSGGLNG